MRGNRLGQRDANEPEIIAALRRLGATVVQLHEPTDLLVGYRGRNLLIEVKSEGGKLTDAQARFLLTWRGQAAVVSDPAEAIRIVAVAGCETR